MTRIAEASFEIDEYWRIVDVLHRRFYNVEWEEWRQSYKALVLLEFLLTHGPEDFAQEFQCDVEIIEELGSFTYIDEKGDQHQLHKQLSLPPEDYKNIVASKNVKHVNKKHIWDGPAADHDKNVLIDSDEDGELEKPKGFVSEIYSKIIGSGSPGSRGKIEFRCISDVGRKRTTKKFDRQYSLWF
ncbi:hypothetical protein SESBI_30733 [Sesbania bispinosa]|nr:hypothetical protein SESBI_30733 [Sesbania bispinosa]